MTRGAGSLCYLDAWGARAWTGGGDYVLLALFGSMACHPLALREIPENYASGSGHVPDSRSETAIIQQSASSGNPSHAVRFLSHFTYVARGRCGCA